MCVWWKMAVGNDQIRSFLWVGKRVSIVKYPSLACHCIFFREQEIAVQINKYIFQRKTTGTLFP